MYLLWFYLILFAKNGVSISQQSASTDLWENEELLPVTKPPVTFHKSHSTPLPNVTCCPTRDNIINDSISTETDSLPLSTKTTPLSIADSNNKKANVSSASIVDEISNQIRMILKHFQEPDPIGIPGQTILTEPFYAPNTTASMLIATGSFFDIVIWGLSNFSVSVVNTRLDDMEVYVELNMKTVLIEGNYSVDNWMVSSEGPFNITLTNVTAIGTVDVATNEEGKLYANKSVIDMNYKNIEIKLSDVSSLLRPFVNTGGVSVLESEKEHILENINQRLVAEINNRLAAIPKIPPLAQISPVDLAVFEGREFVKKHYEPFVIMNVIDFENQFIKLHLGPVNVYGLSKFARVGNVTLSLANDTVTIGIRIITGGLVGSSKWYYDFGTVGVKRFGQSNFTVEHLQFEATVNQSIDSRRSPILEELQIETGPIFVKMDGHGSFDYLVEIVVKLLPKMLRYTIIDALEAPLKEKIQKEILDKISVAQVMEENLADIKNYIKEKL